LIIFHDITRIRRLERMHKDFAANVSHELKTPLTTIKGFIETLAQMVSQGDVSRADAFFGIIEKNVDRMIALINDLLDLSRLERLEGTDIPLESHPLALLFESVKGSCQAGAAAKQITLEIRVPDQICAMLDPVLMEQALINLVDTAVKYSSPGTRVTIDVVPQQEMVKIQVRDEGPGIAEEHLPKIFNRFYRVDKARSRHEGGTGLGLAIVKHIVHYHNGRISVTSEPGKGTRFTLLIPAGSQQTG
jgi:two-component system phosphate regulon sensor histidine kinase PhoR